MNGEQLRHILGVVEGRCRDAVALGNAYTRLCETAHVTVDSGCDNVIVNKAMQCAVNKSYDELRSAALNEVQRKLRLELECLVKNAEAINEHISGIRTIEIK